MEEQQEQKKLIEPLTMTKEDKLKFDAELHSKSQQITQLQKQLSDTHLLLYTEKDLSAKMRAKLKQIQCM